MEISNIVTVAKWIVSLFMAAIVALSVLLYNGITREIDQLREDLIRVRSESISRTNELKEQLDQHILGATKQQHIP